ncbi:MAG: DMT family transporter [Clostridia bacterium]|nr:DMT family transporter [Clostridia bacterium]
MKYLEKHPMIMIVIGVIGISLSSIFVKYSSAPSAVTAAYRLLWTVLLMTPVVFGKREVRRKLRHVTKKTVLLSALSGLFLAVHFAVWFESLRHTSVASSTSIVCTEVIWVALGFCLFLRGRLSWKAMAVIAVTLFGSVLIAFADSTFGGLHLYGDVLALIAAVAVAVYTLLGRVVRETVSTSVYTYLVYIVCAAVLLLFCLAQRQNLFAYGFSAPIVGLLLAIFSTILGHSIFSWCLKFFSPSFVSASKLCEPVVAAIFAGFLFGEIPSLLQILGGVMILSGVYVYSRIERSELQMNK